MSRSHYDLGPDLRFELADPANDVTSIISSASSTMAAMAWDVGSAPEEFETRALRTAPLGRSTATALPPATPSWLPSIRRPSPSCRPDGGNPVTWTWTGFVR